MENGIQLIVDCPACNGRGSERYSTGYRLADWVEVPCPVCGGKGTQIVPPSWFDEDAVAASYADAA
jgi:DnaJ-class molecular chaperone